MVIYSKIDGSEKCECHRCTDEFMHRIKDVPYDAASDEDKERMQEIFKMILCPICGNKRCPHASDHRLECTGSNAPGQPGSVYG
jgi:hypothetical protein